MSGNEAGKFRVPAWIAVLTPLLGMSVSLGHEIDADRLTIVQRSPEHLSLTFRLDEMSVLQRALAPDADPASGSAGVLLSMTAMSDADFARVLDGARARFAAELVLADQDGQIIALSNWRWPPAAPLRQRIRTRAMQSIVGDDPDSHVHDDDHEHADSITVDAIARSPVISLTVALPAAADDLLVVAYRPTQYRHLRGEKVPLHVRF